MDDLVVVLEDGGRGEFALALLTVVPFVVVAIVGPHEGVRRRHVFAVGLFAGPWIAGGIPQGQRKDVRVDLVVGVVGKVDLHVDA